MNFRKKCSGGFHGISGVDFAIDIKRFQHRGVPGVFKGFQGCYRSFQWRYWEFHRRSKGFLGRFKWFQRRSWIFQGYSMSSISLVVSRVFQEVQ